MADVTWGVKVSEDFREKLADLIKESELTSKDFLEQMVQVYELNVAKETVPIIGQDLDELQGLTRRINNIYLGIGERIDNLIKDKDLQYQEILDEKEQLITALQGQIRDLVTIKEDMDEQLKAIDNEKTTICDEMVTIRDEFDKRAKELEEANQNSKALIHEYKEKNDTLSGLLNEHREYKDEFGKVKQELERLEISNRDLQSTMKTKDIEINNLKNQLSYKEQQYKDELERIKERSELDKDRALLSLEQKYQSTIQQMHDEYNNKVRKLLDRLESSDKNE